MADTFELVLVVLAVASYLALAGCFMVAVETRRFTTRGLLLATTAAAITTAILAALTHFPG
jgi:hypothetical protein